MNREQFISKVGESQQALRRFLTALCCGDAQLADDIAQETFIKAYLSCESLNDSDKFKSWVFKIAYNLFIDQRRSMKMTVDVDCATGIEDAERADSSFRYQDLYKALDLLPGKERISVLLYYLEGYSVKEISDINGFSQEAVRQHLSRGRARLRGLLSDDQK